MASPPPPPLPPRSPPTLTPSSTSGVETGEEDDVNGGSIGGGSGSGSGSTQATCAVCKHQRRKCHPECPHARYFPATRGRQFQDVHRLFGVSNLIKIQNRADPGEQRDNAVASMIYEAGMRRLDPVLGACGVIRDLTVKVEATQRELYLVRQQLFLCRQKEKAQLMKLLRSPPPSLPPQVGWFHPAAVADGDGGSFVAPVVLKENDIVETTMEDFLGLLSPRPPLPVPPDDLIGRMTVMNGNVAPSSPPPSDQADAAVWGWINREAVGSGGAAPPSNQPFKDAEDVKLPVNSTPSDESRTCHQEHQWQLSLVQDPPDLTDNKNWVIVGLKLSSEEHRKTATR